eukprot:COSAG02_NODE_47450_length_341_cov_0.632231_1_plen_60_part_10
MLRWLVSCVRVRSAYGLSVVCDGLCAPQQSTEMSETRNLSLAKAVAEYGGLEKWNSQPKL